MSRTLRSVTITALAMMLLSAESGAQTPGEKPPRRWSVSWTLGGAFDGRSTADIEEAMVAAGLDDFPRCSFLCSGIIPHPRSS
jgi:hypothetical protein